MNIKFRPMRACNVGGKDLDNLHYPVIGQPKLDGIRCILLNGSCVSRTLKPIPNRYIRKTLELWAKTFHKQYSVIDGEIIVGSKFQETASAVMSFEGEPRFSYIIFDAVESGLFHDSYINRFNSTVAQEFNGNSTMVITSTPLTNKQEVLAYEESILKRGSEGIILRSYKAIYKFGKSTLKEEYLLKMKRFIDSEAIIEGFEELYTNDNPPMINALGYTERSHSEEGKLPLNTLGKLYVRDLKTGKSFNIGSGFTDKERREIWKNKNAFLGKIVTYKFQNFGIKNLPRSPVFLRFRED